VSLPLLALTLHLLTFSSLLIYMAIGLQKLAAVEVPVWIEMLGIEGKMRLRLQLTPAAPFVKHVAFCFVGAPRIEISAKPLGRRMVIDAMNLPLISSYVLRSIEAVIRDFIAPQSCESGSRGGPSRWRLTHSQIRSMLARCSAPPTARRMSTRSACSWSSCTARQTSQLPTSAARAIRSSRFHLRAPASRST
jgi:hypothetical protein